MFVYIIQVKEVVLLTNFIFLFYFLIFFSYISKLFFIEGCFLIQLIYYNNIIAKFQRHFYSAFVNMQSVLMLVGVAEQIVTFQTQILKQKQKN